jgi:hypothetical protein
MEVGRGCDRGAGALRQLVESNAPKVEEALRRIVREEMPAAG